MTRIVGIDLGAESGRVMVGALDGDALALEEMHRFKTANYERGGGIFWNLGEITGGIKEGLRRVFAKFDEIASIGADTWGVDYALLGADGRLLGDPHHYRDPRNNGVAEDVQRRFPKLDLYKRTGIRTMVFNTVYQLIAEKRDAPEYLARAATVLTIPDYVHYALSGVKVNEFTNASTTQMLKLGRPEWDVELLRELGVPEKLFLKPTQSGAVIGPLLPELAKELGYRGKTPPKIVLPASHDTGSAVAAMPADPSEACFISSGTWSLMGFVSEAPVVGTRSDGKTMSNEASWDGRYRPLRNIMGLWVVQQCRGSFEDAGRSYDYPTLAKMAGGAAAPQKPLDVDDALFYPPGTKADPMPQRVQKWYADRGLKVPQGDGEIIRAVLNGLADAYRQCLEIMESESKRTFKQISVIGGGSQHELLCQLTADATRREVVAGPAEATVLGNMLVQLHGLGLATTHAQRARILGASTKLRTYQPR